MIELFNFSVARLAIGRIKPLISHHVPSALGFEGAGAPVG